MNFSPQERPVLSVSRISRRDGLRGILASAAGMAMAGTSLAHLGLARTGFSQTPPPQAIPPRNRDEQQAIDNGLNWLARSQSRLGHWATDGNTYRVAMTALAGTAFLCEGSTNTQGKYAPQLRKTTDFIVSRARPNGLIGEPQDRQYTYGHGFAMLYLSQILGEEEDEDRRESITDVLVNAVQFCGQAQTAAGGWGYVSAKDGDDFDEGSTTVTQVQGLRSCRNAGIPVPKETIQKAIDYIYRCQQPDGGICYSTKVPTGSRPAITAAAIACLFNAGEYEGENVQRLIRYCKQNIYDNVADARNTFGHWFYTYYYYSQAMYRMGGDDWDGLRDRLYAKLLSKQTPDGSWNDEFGPAYCTALATTMLQLENDFLPIYQR